MVIFLSGDNEYERGKASTQIVNQYVQKHGDFGVEYFDTSLENLSNLKDFVRSQSLFNSIKLAIVKDSYGANLDKEALSLIVSILSSLVQVSHTVIIFSSPALHPDFEVLVPSASLVKEFNLLKGDELIAFLQKEGKRRNKDLSKNDCLYLIENIGTDIQALINEIERISLSKESVSKDEYRDAEIFVMLNKLRSGSSKKDKLLAVEILISKLRADGGYIFNLLTAFAPKHMPQEEWFSLLADYDLAVKSGKLNYEEVLLDMALR